MDDVLGMEIGKCVGHLIDVDGAASFGEATKLCELLVKLALARKFEHEKDALFVVEVTVEAEDIWMPEVLLDFNLPTDLLLHSGLDDLRLVEAFESEDVFWLDLGADHVNSTKFAFAERAANVKVGEMPFSSGACSLGGQVSSFWNEDSEGRTNLETLESRARSWAASPSTASPRFSFSISKPPSYLPISSSRPEEGLTCEEVGAAGWGCCFAAE